MGRHILLIAIVAVAFGFTGIAEGATEVAKILFHIFLAILGVLLIAGLVFAEKAKSLIGR